MEFVAGAQIGDDERPAGAVVFVGAALLVLGPAEIGEHVVIRPASIAELAPQVEILLLSAYVDQPVDRAGAAEHLAARPGQAAAELGPRSLPPASRSNTRVAGSALSRLASTHPAEPAPTTM